MRAEELWKHREGCGFIFWEKGCGSLETWKISWNLPCPEGMKFCLGWRRPMCKGKDTQGSTIRSLFRAGKASQPFLYSRCLHPVSGREWQVTDAGGMSGLRFSAEEQRMTMGSWNRRGTEWKENLLSFKTNPDVKPLSHTADMCRQWPSSLQSRLW